MVRGNGGVVGPRRTRPAEGTTVDNQTLIIILIVVLLLAGGGFYGRGRWY